MRAASVLTAVLLLCAPSWLGAQAARPASAPETFTATAEAKNATGAVSGTLEVRISRYTPDFDRTSVETALKQGGYPGFLTALRKAPQVGQVTLAGGQPFAIRYARETTSASGRTIAIVTDRPVFFVGGGQANPKPRTGYEVAVIQIQISAAGQNSGTMVAAARVRPGGDGSVLLDDYAEEPITLTKIVRK